MADSAISGMSLSELAKLLDRREVSARELIKSCIQTVETENGSINAFVAFDGDLALTQASAIDEMRSNGQSLGPLAGIPLAVKDNYLTLDFPTTACSHVHHARQSKSDAHAVARLREAGAIVVGKTNMHEWAYGATNSISSNGPTHNPWNFDHITGGSSGGSAAALAARMVPAALGSDTGGSIRIPASGCGVCGIKPSYDLVSRNGVLPLSWSLDTAGPMATSVNDLRILLNVLVGNRSAITENANRSGLYSRAGKSKLRLGIPTGYGFEISSEVASVFEKGLAVFRELGAEISPVPIYDMHAGFVAWKTILHSEAAAFHAKFLESDSAAYSENVRIQLEAGRCISAAEYLRSQQFRRVFNRTLSFAMEKYDALVLPTLPVTAPRHDEETVHFGGVSATTQDAMTYVAWLANFGGLPAVSLPCGFDGSGLPVGMMIMGSFGTDFQLLELGEMFQEATGWHRMTPGKAMN